MIRSITALVLLLATPRLAHAMGEADRVDIALLSIGTPPTSEDVSAIERLAWEIEKRTSVSIAPRAVVLGPADPSLRRHPLLVLRGHEALPPLPEASLDALRTHLEAGGLLVIDEYATGDDADDPFDRDVRALTRRLFPRAALARVPTDQVLYKSFYLLGTPFGRRVRQPYLEALMLDGRIAILYVRNDLLGALSRDRLGAFAHLVEPGGEPQREMALRLAINIVLYALCLDYKADQVHAPYLLQRGKLPRP